jgi:hypothetical protein
LSIPASEALQRAEREARSMGHQIVGMAHVLLGLALAPGGGARRVLLRRGVLSETISTRLATLLPPVDDVPIELDRTTIERLVHALQDHAVHGSLARPVTTGDLLLAVLHARDGITDLIAADLGLDPQALAPALDWEELAAPEPGRAVLRPRPVREVQPVPAPPDQPVSEVFETLLDVRSMLRTIADRQARGTASTVEARVASDLEGAVAQARLRLAEERRGCIGMPRRDELAQRRFVTTLRQAYLEANELLADPLAAGHIGS